MKNAVKLPVAIKRAYLYNIVVIKKICPYFLKSTLFTIVVVQFVFLGGYNQSIKIVRRQKMNTDKIYAESIVNEYTVKETTKVVQLKKLDQKAKSPANIFAYTFGVICALILGVGMCLTMGKLGDGSTALFAVGVVVGVIGLVGAGVNYPIYKKILEKGKAKYAADIVRIAKEIADEEE